MIDSKAFGRKLEEFISKKGIYCKEFADQIGTSEHRLNEWISGTKMPNKDFTSRIIESLGLDEDQAQDLRSFLFHDPKAEIIDHNNVYYPTGILIPYNQDKLKEVQSYQMQIDFILDQLASIQEKTEKVSELSGSGKDVVSNGDPEIESEIQEIKKKLENARFTSEQLTAPVILPAPEDIQVRLVSSTSLQRLEEYREEENNWFSLSGVFFGAFLGMLANHFSGGTLSTEGWLLAVILFGFSFLTFISGRRFRARGEKITNQIFKVK